MSAADLTMAGGLLSRLAAAPKIAPRQLPFADDRLWPALAVQGRVWGDVPALPSVIRVRAVRQSSRCSRRAHQQTRDRELEGLLMISVSLPAIEGSTAARPET